MIFVEVYDENKNNVFSGDVYSFTHDFYHGLINFNPFMNSRIIGKELFNEDHEYTIVKNYYKVKGVYELNQGLTSGNQLAFSEND